MNVKVLQDRIERELRDAGSKTKNRDTVGAMPGKSVKPAARIAAKAAAAYFAELQDGDA